MRAGAARWRAQWDHPRRVRRSRSGARMLASERQDTKKPVDSGSPVQGELVEKAVVGVTVRLGQRDVPYMVRYSKRIQPSQPTGTG